MRRKSVGWIVGGVGAAVGWLCMSLGASKDWETDASVAAFTVASTRALIAAGSMAVVEAVEGGSKNASSLGVGDGDGVRFARFLMRV